jgi:hypothetical protein
MNDKRLWDMLLRPLPLPIGTIVIVKDKRYKTGTYKGMILARMAREGKVIAYIIDRTYKSGIPTQTYPKTAWIVSARPESILNIEEE